MLLLFATMFCFGQTKEEIQADIFRQYKFACEEGFNGDACTLIGALYSEKGQYVMAFSYFTRGCFRESSVSCVYPSVMYQTGHGTAKNELESAKHLKKTVI